MFLQIFGVTVVAMIFGFLAGRLYPEKKLVWEVRLRIAQHFAQAYVGLWVVTSNWKENGIQMVGLEKGQYLGHVEKAWRPRQISFPYETPLNNDQIVIVKLREVKDPSLLQWKNLGDFLCITPTGEYECGR